MASNRTSIVLVGLPGAGKTSVGRAAARALGWPFVDFDTEIEHRQHASVAEIFARHGESGFRELECAITEEFAGGGKTVLSAGGGWVTNRDAVALLRASARITYLRVTPQTALARMASSKRSRPLLTVADPLATLAELYEHRRPLYEEADYTIDTEVLEMKEVVEHVQRYAVSLVAA